MTRRYSKRRGSEPTRGNGCDTSKNRRRSQSDTQFDTDTTHASSRHRREHFWTIVKTMDAQLKELYERLSFPSALNFRRAAEVNNLTITLAEAKKFVAKYSQRQVTAPAKRHDGKIVADQLDGRWQADMASYVAQEAKVGGITYTNVLCVLVIFSRFMWTRKLRNASSAAVSKAFASILETSGRKPQEMNVDKGAEFNSSTFRELLNQNGIDNVRVSEGRNDIATLDRAIATLKLLITKRTITTGAEIGQSSSRRQRRPTIIPDTHTSERRRRAPLKTTTSYNSSYRYRQARTTTNKTRWHREIINK